MSTKLTQVVRLCLRCAPAALAMVMAGEVQARDDAEADAGPPKLEEITVTADRRNSYGADLVQAGSFRGARQLDTPLTINVVPDALIKAQMAESLLEALRNTAGVSPAQTSTTVYTSIAIRGINVENRGNYRLDGTLPIINLIDLPLEDKDRVEALKGASALYYGFTAPSGVINLTMKRPTADPFSEVTAFGNQYGEKGGHVDVGNTWGMFGARVNAVYATVESGIDYAGGHRSLLSGAFDFRPFDSLRFSLDAEHIVKQVNEPATIQYRHIPKSTVADLYPAILLPPLVDPTTNFGPRWASNRAEERNVLFSTNWKISDAWALDASYGTSHLQRDRHFNSLDLNTYGPTTDGNGLLLINLQPRGLFDNSNYRAEIAGTFKTFFLTHNLLFGASQNIRDQNSPSIVPALCPGATPTDPRVTCAQNIFNPVDIPPSPFPLPSNAAYTRINDIGYYLFDRVGVTEWLDILGGVRKSDYVETNLANHKVTFAAKPTSVSYGAVLKPRKWISFYGTYIEGLESTALAPQGATNFGQDVGAAPSKQYEGGVKVEPFSGLLAQAAYFDIKRGSTYVNADNLYVLDGEAEYKGAEFSLTGEVTRDWSVYLTGQIIDAKQISGAPTVITTNPTTGAVTVAPTVVGRLIENTPKQTFSLASEYKLPGVLHDFAVNAAAFYMSNRAVNAFNQAFIPATTTFDVGASYRGEIRDIPVTVRVSAQNVTNKWYFQSTGGGFVSEAPPRVIKFSVSTRFSEP